MLVSSKLLFFVLISFILGIFCNSYFAEIGKIIPGFFILSIIFLSTKLSFTINEKNNFVLLSVILIFFTLGFHWNQYNLIKQDESIFVQYTDTKKEIILTGIVVKEPEIKEKTIHLVLKPNTLNNQSLFKSKENVLVIADKYLEINYLDEVSLIGKIDVPKNFNNFDYVGYLAKDRIYSIIFHPTIKNISNENKKLSFSKKILLFREKSNRLINQNFPKPQSAILSAMILGDKSNISNEWQNKFSASGLNHVIAISGMHIMILIFFLNLFFNNIKNKKSKLFLIFFFIFIFVLMTGSSSSAIRAGIMGSIVLFSRLLGRPINYFRILVLAASIMLLLNPLILKSDIGFQLSFLAVLGIIFLFDFFKNFLKFLPENLREIFALSFSANIFIYPLLGYYFQKVSIIFPITNFLILPVISWLMILGLIYILTSFIFSFISYILFFPLLIFLTYLTSIIFFFSKLPWVYLNFNDIKIFLIVFYFCLFISLLNYKNKEKDSVFT